MNVEINHVIIFLIIIYLSNYYSNQKETFTPKEMLSYPKKLNENCKRTTDIFNKLKKMNKARCDPNNKEKTQRDNINTRQVCYDDIGKEIVANYDAESNCIQSKRNNKILSTKSEILTNSDTLHKSHQHALITTPSTIDLTSKSSIIKSNEDPWIPMIDKSKANLLKPDPSSSNIFDFEGEGPGFINKTFLNTYDDKNSLYSNTSFDKPIGNNKYSDLNFKSDINFSSDPALLYRMSKSK